MVGLPKLQERVTDQVAIAVIDIAQQQNMLARGSGFGHLVPDFLLAGWIASRLQRQADMHVRASRLRRGFW
ncbi:hypothetical protein D3C81_2292690 [compost metagenome]